MACDFRIVVDMKIPICKSNYVVLMKNLTNLDNDPKYLVGLIYKRTV